MSLTLDEEERLSEILEVAAGNNQLTDWELNFIDDHVHRFEEHGSNIHVTRKQWEVLERIATKIGA